MEGEGGALQTTEWKKLLCEVGDSLCRRLMGSLVLSSLQLTPVPESSFWVGITCSPHPPAMFIERFLGAGHRCEYFHVHWLCEDPP